jgi:uncharacterized protein
MLQKFYKILLKYPKHFLAGLFLITIFFGYYALKLQIDASSETLFLEDDKDLAFYRENQKNFNSPDALVIAYSPKSDMLSQQSIDTIKNISKDIEKLSLTESVTSILNVPLLQNSNNSQDGLDNIVTLDNPKTNKNLARKELITSELYKQNLVSKDFKTSAIVINMKYDKKYFDMLNERNKFYILEKKQKLNSKQQKEYNKIKKEFKQYRKLSKKLNHIYINNIREIISKYQSNAKMHLGGANMIADDMIEFVKYDLKIFGVLVFVLVVFMLWFIFRKKRWVILTLLMSAISLIITAGVISFMGLEISVVSSNFILLQIILTMPLIIHMITRYMDIVSKYPNWDNRKILEFLLKDMSEPAFYVSITNVAGFGSLVTSDMLPIADYGWMMSIGAIVYLIVIFIVLPTTLIIIGKGEVTFVDKKSKISYLFARLVEKYKIFIFMIVVIVSVVSIIGAKKLYVENSFINYFKHSTEIYQGMEVLDQNLGGTTPLDVIVTFKDNNTSPVETKISSSIQSDAILDDFESEFNTTNNDKKYWLTKEKLETIKKVHKYLESIPQVGKVLSISTTANVAQIIKNGKELDSVDLAFLQNNLSSENKKILIDPYINIEKNQARITTRVVDSDPTLRRDVLIKKINNDLKNILDNKYENAKVSNLLVLYNNVLQSLFDSQIKTLGWALFTIFIMFLMLFRNVKLSFIALIANSIPIMVLFGTMGYLGIPLDIMTITIAAISVGITVDNTIHYMHTFETELKETDGNYIKSLYNSHASTGMAMYYAAIIVIVGFSILTLSNFMPTVYFGILTVVVMLVAMIGDLLLTPTLIMVTKPFKYKK